ncbi:MAG: hypothetical protein EZS28_013937 [Streblomastix strix]|uniref:Uncharacterized protein n=1 Tax=Streblomastix strix TaxID=222440 RepID=A0A5J4W777_9EUKA|nr:MAG: hypothetical protein EZS28_013937 [Streblomastix strix]
MLKPEIKVLLADKGFVHLTFETDGLYFMQKLNTFKLYMLGKQMMFVDLSQSKPGHQAALLLYDCELPTTTVSSIEDSDSGSHSQQKRCANRRKNPFLSHQAVQDTQGPEDIIECILDSASKGDIVFQLRIQVDLVALSHHEEQDFIRDITITAATMEMESFEKNWLKQLEFICIFNSIQTRLYLEALERGQQKQIGCDTRICDLLRNQLKCNQANLHKFKQSAPEQFLFRRARQSQRFVTLQLNNNNINIQLMCTSCAQLRECFQDRSGLHILPKDTIGIKHWLATQLHQFNSNLSVITSRIIDGTIIIKKKDTYNRFIINEHRIVKNLRSRILND